MMDVDLWVEALNPPKLENIFLRERIPDGLITPSDKELVVLVRFLSQTNREEDWNFAKVKALPELGQQYHQLLSSSKREYRNKHLSTIFHALVYLFQEVPLTHTS